MTAAARRDPAAPGKPFRRLALCEPDITPEEWTWVKACLESGWVSSAGPFVEKFSKLVAEYVGARYAVATASGTAALHVALQVAGVGPDDEVVLPSLTFVATANAVRYLGAWPTFVDVDPVYWQMDPAKVRDFLRKECRWRQGTLYNRATRRRVRALLPVHLLGHPSDLDALRSEALKFDLLVLEDAAQGLGTEYKGRRVGAASRLACFSFNGNKLVTAGGGGMIVTDSERWADRARYLTTQAKDNAIESVHGSVGYNYRLNSLQAALGCAQLGRIESLMSAKRHHAAQYREELAGVSGLVLPTEAPWARSTFWLYSIQVDAKGYGMDSRGLLRRLEERGIEARPLYQPLHRSPAHLGAYHSHIEVADRIYRDALSLPSSVGLTAHDIRRVTETIRGPAKRMVPDGRSSLRRTSSGKVGPQRSGRSAPAPATAL